MLAHLRLIAAFAVIATAAPQVPDVFDLEPADVARLEQTLKANPEDLGARRMLMAYHLRADRVKLPAEHAEVVRHALWLMEHHPESEVVQAYGRFTPGELTPAQYQRVVALWAAAPKTGSVQWNAAQFFLAFDPSLHLHYLEAAVVADPDHARAIRTLAFLYARALLEPGQLTARAQAGIEASKNRWVLSNTAYTLQSLYNEKLQRGETDQRATQLAERYFLRAKALDASMDRNKILPQIDLAAIARQRAAERPLPPEPPTRQLSIDAFSQLPPAVAAALRARGCTIPQPDQNGVPRNVIRGQFFRNGESGWAVFCAKGGTTTLLAFRNDRDTQPDVVSTNQNPNEYPHEIFALGHQEILRQYRMAGGAVPPAMDHQAIADAMVDKAASTRWYFNEGKWLKFPVLD